MKRQRRSIRWLIAIALLAYAGAGCTGMGNNSTVDNPLPALQDVEQSPRVHYVAMELLDQQGPTDAYVKTLQRMMWEPRYLPEVREAALERLEAIDQDQLKRTIRQYLPRITARAWHNRLCEIIVERGWIDLAPALISSWAVPRKYEEQQRPEYLALLELYGTDEVVDVVFATFVESNKVSQQGLRMRCWQLLHRLGERGRLIELLNQEELAQDDPMLNDLRAGAVDLGIVPVVREEILWLRKIKTPQHADFWSDCVAAIESVPDDRRAELELRDIPIVVAAWRHRPELLVASTAQLYAILQEQLADAKHYPRSTGYEGSGRLRESLENQQDILRWGDLAAMVIAMEAMQVPEVVGHLLHYAERDRLDESTEYGGVIGLDEQGRFEVLEFPPRIRQHDRKFVASQEMFNASYTALFHFHYHVQELRNLENAGPGIGDHKYAQNTRANNLVLTYVKKGVLNIDYYRHGSLVVDLGVINEP
jgi:hypothetical protein